MTCEEKTLDGYIHWSRDLTEKYQIEVKIRCLAKLLRDKMVSKLWKRYC